MYIAPIRAGDSSSFEVSPYSNASAGELSFANGWALKFCIKGNGNNLEVAADDSWNIVLGKADTEDLVPGDCQWALVASKNDLQITADFGLLKVLPKILGADPTLEFRSKDKVMLDTVQAAIKALVAGSVKEYSVNGRSLKRVDLPELMALESSLMSRVAREDRAEKIKRGESDPRLSRMRFRCD